MIAVTLLAALAAAPPTQLCTLCHPEVRVQFESSIHRSEEVTCTSCHGGNSSASTVAGAHRGEFRGRIRRRDVPELCASCHADTALMRPYNLPTDQLALYRTSRHGRLLETGDDNVAVCTDCHGVHDTLGTEDPRSRVHVDNVAETCAGCHSNRSLMGGYGRTEDPYADFVAGVHGQALLERGNDSAPECSRCHGSHGAAPPGFGDVDKVCGQCHATARAHFLEGPHKAAMEEVGLPECASCHGHHRIARADIGVLEEVCARCHEAGSRQADLAAQMRTLYMAASEDIERARGLVDEAAAIPLYTDDYEARLEEARTSLIESLPAMHSLDISLIEDLTHRARSIGHEVASEVGGKLEGRKWRRVGLMIFWFYLLVTVAILARLRRRAAREGPP